MAEVTDLLLLPLPLEDSDAFFDDDHPDLPETLDPSAFFPSNAAADGFDSLVPDLASDSPLRIFSHLAGSDASDSGSDYLEGGASLAFDLFDHGGMDLRFAPSPVFEIQEDDDDVDVDIEGAVEESDWGADEFFLGRRSSVSDSIEFSRARPVDEGGLRIVDFDSDSDSDEQIVAICDDQGPDRDLDDAGLPICWDCLHIEDDRREANEEFEWEEVGEDDDHLEEREVISMMGVADDDASYVLREMAHEREDAARNVEWEVLLSVNNLGMNPMDPEDAQLGVGLDIADDFDGDEGFVYTAEYDIVIGLPDHDSSLKGTPPAAKSVVDNLPSVVLTEEDIAKNTTTCAVCKDDIPVNERAKKLPCCHYYHEECILPWLVIRNTCPLCRFELPTDDPEYEKLKAWRTSNGVLAEESQVRYNFEMLNGA